jgi:hypothetical protein
MYVIEKPKKRGPKPRKRISRRPKARSLKAQKRDCDIAWSKRIKESGRCWFQGKDGHVCKGDLQAMHLISRRYHTTRWELWNGLPGCAAIHTYYTYNPEAWGLFLAEYWGVEKYRRILELARTITKPDYGKIMEALSG